MGTIRILGMSIREDHSGAKLKMSKKEIVKLLARIYDTHDGYMIKARDHLKIEELCKKYGCKYK